jgi:large subunit ribosomal protein L29
MATKTKKNINAPLSAEELVGRISDEQLKLKKLQFSHAITPIENPLTIRATKKEIARLKTAQRRLQLGF